MNHSFYNFGLILLFLVGFSFCGDPSDISSYDPEEFDVNELLNDPHVIDALESNGSNVEEGSSNGEPLRNGTSKSEIPRNLISLGMTFNGSNRIPERFNRLHSAGVNPHNLSSEELEMHFQNQEWPHRWWELEKYPVAEYTNYWAHVCDYFWVKKNRADRRYRACYVKPLVFSENTFATVTYRIDRQTSSLAEVLRCTCYYYVKERCKPVSPSEVFAIHKYSDSEYFIMIRATEKAKNTFEVFNFWTKVTLPLPFK